MRLVMLLICAVGHSPAQTSEAKPLSVCEVLAQLPTLNGKEVAVRGMWFATDEGQWLVHPGESCSQNLVTEGFVWRPSLHLVQAKNRVVDTSSSSDVQQKFKAAQDEPDRYYIIETYFGILVARVPPIVVHYPDGSLTGYGFGHLNTSPAELTYKRTADVELVERKPAPKAP